LTRYGLDTLCLCGILKGRIKALDLNLANMSDDLRKRYEIKDSVITGVEAQSAAADKRLNAGDVVVEGCTG
jgi:hypothetical protein